MAATERGWDNRVAHLLAKLPDRGRRAVERLRVPERRWLRLGVAVLLVLGGFLSLLSVRGIARRVLENMLARRGTTADARTGAVEGGPPAPASASPWTGPPAAR